MLSETSYRFRQQDTDEAVDHAEKRMMAAWFRGCIFTKPIDGFVGALVAQRSSNRYRADARVLARLGSSGQGLQLRGWGALPLEHPQRQRGLHPHARIFITR